MTGNTASALTTKKAFLNNFENLVNRRVDIREDIKRYQDSYASTKVDYSIGEGVYMLPSNVKLNTRSGTAGYNNKILVSDGTFSLGKNSKVNASAPKKTSQKHTATPKVAMKRSEKLAHSATTHGLAQRQAITREDKRATLILFLTGGLTMWFMFC